jgi:DNA-binding response OmpR family regulator
MLVSRGMGTSALEIGRSMRAQAVKTPILLLTARAGVSNKVEGLRSGADDYLTKPFHFEELLARLEALTRGSGRHPDGLAAVAGGRSRSRSENDEVRRGDRLLKLTSKEPAILELLLSGPGMVFSRRRILSRVWGLGEDPLANVVDVCIACLRRQIDDGAASRRPSYRFRSIRWPDGARCNPSGALAAPVRRRARGGTGTGLAPALRE